MRWGTLRPGVMTGSTGDDKSHRPEWSGHALGIRRVRSEREGSAGGRHGDHAHPGCVQYGHLSEPWSAEGHHPLDGRPAQVAVSDVLGREIRRAGVSFARQVVATDTLYDARGQALKTSRPYVTGAATSTIKWHTFTYDAIGRPLTETAPDGSVTRSAYTGLTTTLTNAGGQVNKRKYNVRDELIRATDAAGTLTDYTYDPFGNLIKTLVDAAATGKRVSTTHSYDTRGRKTGTTDPDRGNWSYRYNTLGELLRQTDAKGQVTTYGYDLLGRLVRRTDDATDTANANVSAWTYDSTTTAAAGKRAHSLGKPVRSSGGEGDTSTYRYDRYGRPAGATTWLDADADGVQEVGEVYSTSRDYDTDGRLDMLTYPESPHHPFGLGVTYHYTVDGHLKALRRADTGNLYWQAEAVNAAGQLTRALAGNGVTTYRDYDAATGLPDTFRSRTSLAAVGVNDVQDLEYAFDTLGNLTGRTTETRANGVNTATYSETFSYDNRNRLTQSRFSDGVTTPVTRSYRYDALGNLTHKSDVSTGNYVYGTAGATCTAAGPHAVAQVGAQCLTYDANGNQTGGYNFTQKPGPHPDLDRLQQTPHHPGRRHHPDVRLRRRPGPFQTGQQRHPHHHLVCRGPV